jgi:hypothetical protein
MFTGSVFENPHEHKDARVWRYLSFGRYVWLLAEKALWLSRADRLNDDWELFFTPGQISQFLKKIPPDVMHEQGLKEIILTMRRYTFVSCWSVSEHESYEMWQTYCSSSEGVAVRTTVGHLLSLGRDINVVPVRYYDPANTSSDNGTERMWDPAAQKRWHFSDENEIRVIKTDIDGTNKALAPPWHYRPPEAPELGTVLPINVPEFIQAVVVHPRADTGFRRAVKAVTTALAPTLMVNIATSDIAVNRPW